MCMDIMYFQKVQLEYLLTQTLACICAWHSDMVKRFAEYDSATTATGPARSSGGGMYRDGTMSLGHGLTRNTISFDTISGMTPSEAAQLQASARKGR